MYSILIVFTSPLTSSNFFWILLRLLPNFMYSLNFFFPFIIHGVQLVRRSGATTWSQSTRAHTPKENQLPLS